MSQNNIQKTDLKTRTYIPSKTKIKSENILLRSPSKRLKNLGKHLSTEQIGKNEDSFKNKLSCKCSNTKCIKLYCICFKNDEFCGPDCDCKDCLNFPEDGNIRENKKKVLVQPDELSYSNRFKSIEIQIKSPNGKMIKKGNIC